MSYHTNQITFKQYELFSYTYSDAELNALTQAAQNSVDAFQDLSAERQNANNLDSVLRGCIGEFTVMEYLNSVSAAFGVSAIEAPDLWHYFQFNTVSPYNTKGDVICEVHNIPRSYEVKTVQPEHARSMVKHCHLQGYLKKNTSGIFFVSYDENTQTATIYGYCDLLPIQAVLSTTPNVLDKNKAHFHIGLNQNGKPTTTRFGDNVIVESFFVLPKVIINHL